MWEFEHFLAGIDESVGVGGRFGNDWKLGVVIDGELSRFLANTEQCWGTVEGCRQLFRWLFLSSSNALSGTLSGALSIAFFSLLDAVKQLKNPRSGQRFLPYLKAEFDRELGKENELCDCRVFGSLSSCQYSALLVTQRFWGIRKCRVVLEDAQSFKISERLGRRKDCSWQGNEAEICVMPDCS